MLRTEIFWGGRGNMLEKGEMEKKENNWEGEVIMKGKVIV